MTFNLSAVPAFQPQPLLPGWRSDLAPPVVFAFTGLILAAGVMPGFHWHDTAEFGAVASRLSLSHPPGHPLHALTTRAVLELPLGDLACRANVASSVCLAFALSVFARVLGVLAPGLSWFERFVFASWPVVFPVVFLQGIRAEVYALNLLVTLGVAYCAVELRPLEGGRFFVALALLVGLGLGNHSLLIAALAPIVVWRAARAKLRRVAQPRSSIVGSSTVGGPMPPAPGRAGQPVSSRARITSSATSAAAPRRPTFPGARCAGRTQWTIVEGTGPSLASPLVVGNRMHGGEAALV